MNKWFDYVMNLNEVEESREEKKISSLFNKDNLISEDDNYYIVYVENFIDLKRVWEGTDWENLFKVEDVGSNRQLEKKWKEFVGDNTILVALKKRFGKKEPKRVNSEESRFSRKNIYPYWDKVLIKLPMNKDELPTYITSGGFEYNEPKVKLEIPFGEIGKETKKETKTYTDKNSNKTKLTDIFEDVVLDDSILVDGKIPFKYGKVYGNFSLTKCKTLKSYEGCPEIVYGDFKAAIKSDIENFEGCPKFVGGNFDASGHISLKNLKGSPEKVVKKYIISHCDNLKNLEGSSKDVGGFICSYCKELETLDGAPIVVRGDFVATFCKNLLSVMKLPKDISGKIDMTGCSRLSIRDLRNRFGYTLPDNFIHDLKESFEIKLKRMYLKEKYENNI